MNTKHPYNSLTPDCVLDAIESAGLISDGRIYPLNSYENRVYQIGIEEDSPIIAKFYRPNRWNKAQIQEEHDFCLELVDSELPVVPPLKDKKGETIQEHAGFYFTLFERKGGHALETDNLHNLEIMGRFLGRMHSIGQSRPFRYRQTITIQVFAKESQTFLLSHPFIPLDLETEYKKITNELIFKMEEQLACTPYTTIRLHGDCHAGNVLWRNNSPHFVDFDDTLSGPAVQDFWMLLSGKTIQQQQQLNAILNGYRQFCTFNTSELALIEVLRTFRIMHYAAWLAKRWDDPAFPHTFTWFNTYQYWSEHLSDLRAQLAALNEPPLTFASPY